MHNLKPNTTVQFLGNNLTAGTDAAYVQHAVSVDMARFDGVLLIAIVSGVTNSQFAFRAKAAATTDGHSAVGSTVGRIANIPATAVGENTRVFIIDVARPRSGSRYIRVEYQRTVANSQVTIIAIPYAAKTKPAIDSVSVGASAVVSGPEPSAS